MTLSKSIFLVALAFGAPVSATQIDWPSTKYQIGDCITPTDPEFSWFGEVAFVSDLVFSQSNDAFLYKLSIFRDGEWSRDLFYVKLIEDNTAQLKVCPS